MDEFGTKKPHRVSNSGFAVSAQTNSVARAYDRLVEMARGLGICQCIERSGIEHFFHAAQWLKTNPSMLVRLTSHTGDMYENQFVYRLNIRSAASALLMLHALSVKRDGTIDKFSSSAHVNNWETLDIRHYLIGEGRPLPDASAASSLGSQSPGYRPAIPSATCSATPDQLRVLLKRIGLFVLDNACYIKRKIGADMAKVVVKKLGGPKSGVRGKAVTEKRVRDSSSGQFVTVRTIDAKSQTFGQDLTYVFSKNVAKARRDNKAVTGVVDRAPAKA